MKRAHPYSAFGASPKEGRNQPAGQASAAVSRVEGIALGALNI